MSNKFLVFLRRREFRFYAFYCTWPTNLKSFTLRNRIANTYSKACQIAWSYQYVPSPHITIVYSGVLPTFNSTTRLLTGLWGNGDPFSIYLSAVPNSDYGYSPAIDNIKFTIIPEPASLILLAVGGLLLRRK